jgi:hypothetical protein
MARRSRCAATAEDFAEKPNSVARFVEAIVHPMTFDLPLVANCLSVICTVFLFLATRRAEQRLAIILLCSGFLVGSVSRLIGLRGTDAAIMFGVSLGFTVSALVAVLWRSCAVQQSPEGQ